MDKRKFALIIIGIMVFSSFGYAMFSPFVNIGNEAVKDSDGDGIPDNVELELMLDPYKKETINDIIKKKEEVTQMVINNEISADEYRKLIEAYNELIEKMNKTKG